MTPQQPQDPMGSNDIENEVPDRPVIHSYDEMMELLRAGEWLPLKPAKSKESHKEKTFDEKMELLKRKPFPETVKFGNIPKGDWSRCILSLCASPFIITADQKTMLLVRAVDEYLYGSMKQAKLITWNAAILGLVQEDPIWLILFDDSKDWPLIEKAVEHYYSHFQKDILRACGDLD